MLVPIVVHKDANSVYGVTVPDLAGCFSSGETYDQAIEMAKDAIEFHLEGLVMNGENIPDIKTIEELQLTGEFDDAHSWAIVEVDLTKYASQTKRINVSIPQFVLNQIDQYAQLSGKSRSSVLAEGALKLVTKPA
ncbi:MAG: type II toxin-antitoxin system HicB family antitoxin [Pseudomonadota bacterium]